MIASRCPPSGEQPHHTLLAVRSIAVILNTDFCDFSDPKNGSRLTTSRWDYPTSNVDSGLPHPHNAEMSLGHLFLGFLQPVALGSVAVLVLLLVIGLRTPRRSPALLPRRPSR